MKKLSVPASAYMVTIVKNIASTKKKKMLFQILQVSEIS